MRTGWPAGVGSLYQVTNHGGVYLLNGSKRISAHL